MIAVEQALPGRGGDDWPKASYSYVERLPDAREPASQARAIAPLEHVVLIVDGASARQTGRSAVS